MADYGRDVEFGISFEPLADPPGFAARLSRAVDRGGLDLVSWTRPRAT